MVASTNVFVQPTLPFFEKENTFSAGKIMNLQIRNDTNMARGMMAKMAESFCELKFASLCLLEVELRTVLNDFSFGAPLWGSSS